MNRAIAQKYILPGVLIMLLGGIVLLTPAQEAGQSVTQETAEPALPNRPPEGYQVPARPAVTFPHTNISADRLRLANVRKVSDDEVLVFVGLRTPSIVSPDGQWKLSHRSDGVTIARTDGSGETRLLVKEEPDFREDVSAGPFWSWDSSRAFYEVSNVYSPTPDSPVLEHESWIESVDIATGEITRHTDIGPDDGLRSFATARYPNDPVIYRDREDEIDSVGTRDGSARWVIGYDIFLSSLSPDKQMVRAGSKGGHFRYLIYATDGSGLLHSFEFDRNGAHPANGLLWSPDSTKFFYHQVERRESNTGIPIVSDLYLMNTDGTGRTQLTDTPDTPEGIVGWTPDGQLVFIDYRNGDLYIADLVAK